MLYEVITISNNLNLPKSILETASVIYRKAVKERLIRGRSIQGVTSAAIYLACRQCGLPRTLDEISQSSTVNKKEVGRSYRFLIRELNYSIPPLRPSQYITKFSNQLTIVITSYSIHYTKLYDSLCVLRSPVNTDAT